MSKNPEELQLEAFVGKLLEIQREQTEGPLQEEELREIAFSVGMSDSDWQRSRQQLAQYLQQAKAHLAKQNYVDALESVTQALSLHPQFPEALLLGAQAYLGQFQHEGLAHQHQKTEDWAKQALAYGDAKTQQAATETLQTLRLNASQKVEKKQQLWKQIGMGIGAVLLLILGLFFFTQSQMQQASQKLDAQWANLDGVYQRRLDLMQKVQAVLDKNQSMALQKALEAMKKSPAGSETYAQEQANLSRTLLDIQANLQQENQLHEDLLAQIEGAENRISVERRRYNEAVSAYNQVAQGLLPKLFGYSPKPYFAQGAIGKDVKLE